MNRVLSDGAPGWSWGKLSSLLYAVAAVKCLAVGGGMWEGAEEP